MKLSYKTVVLFFFFSFFLKFGCVSFHNYLPESKCTIPYVEILNMRPEM